MAKQIENHDGSKKCIPDDVPPATVDHFLAMPYARAVIQDPTLRILSQSRTVTHDGKGHTLMGKTWSSESTIPQLLTLFGPSTSSNLISASESERAEMKRFYTFGGDLNAHPDLLHGGVVGCVLDSSLGGAVGMTLAKQTGGPPTFTVQLNITYKAPIRTPGTVMVRSWVTEIEDGGRKAWAKGVIESEGGVVHALAEGMWLRPKAKI
ncbi:Putative Thioesterase domain, HotDog domain superfamily [Septoria linicola]|uniref:Thioesterase domain, HotDog domain superfamily n=1 Tax=Septoria linicola TaxID=215465 RepID=A0A9Q9AQ67_9PEZI|nr:Putative Thioesterase domain, HotDog domain superfamily [Septoria linicola]